MTTLSDARGMWCPFGRVVSVDHNIAVNRAFDGVPDSSSMCLGAACMAWRWVDGTFKDGVENAHGYCGLAGSPR